MRPWIAAEISRYAGNGDASAREGIRLAHALPGGRSARSAPAQVSHRRRRKRNALERKHTMLGDPLHLAGLGFDTRRILRVAGRGIPKKGACQGERQNR
jgi:hypothetical protein